VEGMFASTDLLKDFKKIFLLFCVTLTTLYVPFSPLILSFSSLSLLY
jgi:hypothetical protein